MFNEFLYISDIDTANLYVHFFTGREPLAHCAVPFKCCFICNILWAFAYKSLKTKEKSSCVIPKVVTVAYGSSHLRELFITKFKSQFKQGFTKVVITRAGGLREWSQGDLWLYYFNSITGI